MAARERNNYQEKLLEAALYLTRMGQSPKPAIAEYCQATGRSESSAYSFLAKNGVHRPVQEANGSLRTRKTRADKGKSMVPEADALLISGMVARSDSKLNHKPRLPLTAAVEHVIGQGLVAPASVQTYRRRLIDMHADPASLRQPAPYRHLSTPYPNFLWQIDASRPAQWYLRQGRFVYDRKREMLSYKDRPQKNGVLLRVVIAEHFTNSFLVRYFLTEGGERTEDFIRALYEAMRYKGESFPFFGIPTHLYADPGPALNNAAARELCAQMGITLRLHKPGAPNSKGSVETRNKHFESRFERLCLARGTMGFTLAELNQAAFESCRSWCEEHAVERLGMTAFAAFRKYIGMNPRAGELPPDFEEMKALAVGRKFTRVVNGDYSVSFDKRLYMLDHLAAYPEIQLGSEIVFHIPLGRPDCIEIHTPDGLAHVISPQARRLDGRPEKSSIYGEDFMGVRDDLATKTRKRVAQTPLPGGVGPIECGTQASLCALGPQMAVISAPTRHIPACDWIDLYEQHCKTTKREAARVFKARYGAANEAPENEALEPEELRHAEQKTIA